MNRLGLGPIALTIVEASEPAASWSGRNGMTSGEEPLAIPPIKDVGFPYQSYQEFGDVGEEIDRAMMPFTWQQYMIGERRYVRWVNAGSPPIQHRTYGKYLAWVLSRATEGVQARARAGDAGLARSRSERWRIDVEDCTDAPLYRGRALALTGPGVHRPFPHDAEAAPRIFHCDSRRIELARIPIEQSADIAIVGGGESALSCVAFLRAFRPDAELTIYTPSLPMSRGESFLENRVFSNPDEVAWDTLDPQTRRDFVRHCDRGVFDPAHARDDRLRRPVPVRHRARDARLRGGRRGRGVRELRRAAGREMRASATTTWSTAPGSTCSSSCARCSRRRCGRRSRAGSARVWDRPPGAEIPIGRNLELEGMRPRLHIPGLGALSQGPGFANLGSLGLLANRVLEPLFSEQDAQIQASRNSITEVV